MGSLHRVQMGWFILLLSALLALVAPQASFAVDKFVVAAPVTSGALHQFMYDPTTGQLSKGDGTVIEAFGKIPGLKSQDVVAHKLGHDRFLVIQHAHWISVIDVVEDKPVVMNLGPFTGK